jgi:hypothetical protein
MLLRTLFDAPQRRIPQSLERVLRAKPACETNENNFFLQSVAKGPVQGMPRTNRLSQTRADASIRVRARAQNDAWTAIGLFFGCLACFIAVTVGSVIGIAAAFGAFSSSSQASPPNSPNNGVGVQNVQTLFPPPASPPFPMAPPGNVLRYRITASVAFEPNDGFVLDETAMGSLGGDVNVTVLNSDASIAASAVDAVDTSQCNDNFVLVTLQTSTFDSSYIQTFTQAVQGTFILNNFLLDANGRNAICCGAPVILGVTTTHVIAPPPSIPPQVVAEYVCFNATIRRDFGNCNVEINITTLKSCMIQTLGGVYKDDIFREELESDQHVLCVMTTERADKDKIANAINADNFRQGVQNCMQMCEFDNKSSTYLRHLITEAMPPLPSPPPNSPPLFPPSPPPPASPIRLSMGAINHTFALNGGEYSVDGQRCKTELTQDDCRLYSSRSTGIQHFTLYDDQFVSGPGCLVSRDKVDNEYYEFRYNTANTSYTCSNTLEFICVCDDTKEDDSPVL